MKLEEVPLGSWGMDGWMEAEIARRCKDGWIKIQLEESYVAEEPKSGPFTEVMMKVQAGNSLLHDLLISLTLFIILQCCALVCTQLTNKHR